MTVHYQPAVHNGWSLGVSIFLPRFSRGRHEPNKQGHIGHRALLPRSELHMRDFAHGSCILKYNVKKTDTFGKLDKT